MLKISKQQALKRWDTLPDNLKEALFSEYNAETLWRICESQHLSDDKIEKVATLTGDVILGFLHPEDLGQEIRKDINVAVEVANTIASEIDRKIFAPIKSDLEKVYSPVTTQIGTAEIEEVEIKEREQEAIESEKPTVTEIRKPEAPIKIVEEKEIKPAASKIEQPKIITIEEKIEENKKEELPTVSAVEPSAVESPAASGAEPLILHKETEFKPLSETKKSLKSLGGLFGFLKKKEKTEETKPVKAEVEGIEIRPPKIEEIKSFGAAQDKPIEMKVKVVNYVDTPEQQESQESIKTEQHGAIEIAKPAETEENKEQKGEEVIDLSKL